MAKVKKFAFNIKKRILPVIILSVCIPLILFIAIPFEIYANNMDEFLFSLSDFFLWCILFGFLLAAGIVCILLFLPEKAYRIVYALILSISFMLFLQGTFLNFGMNSLAGDKLADNDVSIGLKILDIIIWVVVIAASVVLSLIKDTKGIISIIAVILSIVVAATQIVNPLTNIINHPDVFDNRIKRLEKENDNFKNEVLTCENLASVASERNVFYFCVDRFDEYFAEIAYEIQPDIYDNLDGFTWFKDHLSLYPQTYPSIAYMLTENKFDPSKLRKEHLNTVYNDNNTLSVLNDNGYSINLYTESYYAYNIASNLPDYVSNISLAKRFEVSNPMRLLQCMYSTSFIRCMPLFIKDMIPNQIDTVEFNGGVISTGVNGYDGYKSDNSTVFGQVSGAPFENNGEKNFSFVHIYGCHTVLVDNLNDYDNHKGEIVSAVKSSFQVVNEYINVLKARGLYKDATIVITGDHPMKLFSDGTSEGAPPTALFFKPSGVDSVEGGGGTPFSESYAPVAHEDIWPSIMKSEGIERENEGAGLLEIDENDVTRERNFIWYETTRKDFDEYIYTVKGSARNFANWMPPEHNHYGHTFF